MDSVILSLGSNRVTESSASRVSNYAKTLGKLK